MSRNYTVRTRIEKPAGVVYDAIVSADTQTRYFTGRTSGDLAEGARIIWHWDEWGDFPVTVRRLVKDRLIELTLSSKEWQKTKDDAYDVLVTFEIEGLEGGATMLSISESGWKTDADGLKGSHDNCSGWTHMAMCLKGYLEHGVDLR
jgi:uncharacterized protein YndB with AHSA1/START domain